MSAFHFAKGDFGGGGGKGGSGAGWGEEVIKFR